MLEMFLGVLVYSSLCAKSIVFILPRQACCSYLCSLRLKMKNEIKVQSPLD